MGVEAVRVGGGDAGLLSWGFVASVELSPESLLCAVAAELLLSVASMRRGTCGDSLFTHSIHRQGFGFTVSDGAYGCAHRSVGQGNYNI